MLLLTGHDHGSLAEYHLRVKGGEIGPVVYILNGSSDPLTSCSSLALRWDILKATASWILARLDQLGYINVLPFSDRHGTVLYLENYLSVMFQISDLPIHKEDVALRLRLKAGWLAEESCVSFEKNSVSKRIMLELLPKLLQSLAAWVFSAVPARKNPLNYILYPPLVTSGS